MVSKQAQRDDSPLLSLPAEIRNMIYEYVFGVDHIQAMQYNMSVAGRVNNKYEVPGSTYTMIFEVRDTNNWRSLPQQLTSLLPLTTTCHQIREESRLLPFSGNLFDVGIHAIQHFLAVVPREILNNIKIISLWKSPGQMMTSVGNTHFVQAAHENDRRVWVTLVSLLSGLPALEKVILHVRGGVRGLDVREPWEVQLKQLVEMVLERVMRRKVELEML
jgi:hypothetical protein